MYGRKETLYDVLDLPRDADAKSIAHAHRRALEELERETTAPDARRAALLHEAYEVLSDPERRAAYDRSLSAPEVVATPVRREPWPRWAGAAAGLAALVAATYFTWHKPAAPSRDGAARTPAEILAAASFSVGSVQAIDLTGRSTPVALAVAIADGVMVTTCHGLAPGAQLVVRLAERVASANAAMADAGHDLCKLSVEGAGSRPFPLRPEPPRAGDAVFVVTFDNDKLVARPATIRGLISTPRGNVIEIGSAVPPSASGAPVVDAGGRLVGIMTTAHAFGAGRNVALPAAWLDNPRWIAR